MGRLKELLTKRQESIRLNLRRIRQYKRRIREKATPITTPRLSKN